MHICSITFHSMLHALYMYLYTVHVPISFVLPPTCTYVSKGRMHASSVCNELHHSWHYQHLFLPDSLDEHDLQSVLTEIKSVSQLQSLGLALGLLASAIEKIRKEFTSVKEQKIELIKCWLRRMENIREMQSCPPTWSQLADAVAEDDVALSNSIEASIVRHV